MVRAIFLLTPWSHACTLWTRLHSLRSPMMSLKHFGAVNARGPLPGNASTEIEGHHVDDCSDRGLEPWSLDTTSGRQAEAKIVAPNTQAAAVYS